MVFDGGAGLMILKIATIAAFVLIAAVLVGPI
jgi:hypothetical protein